MLLLLALYYAVNLSDYQSSWHDMLRVARATVLMSDTNALYMNYRDLDEDNARMKNL